MNPLAAGSASQMIVVATHALLAGPAVRRLLALPIDRLLTTDSVTMVRDIALPVQVVILAPLIADVDNASSREQIIGRPHLARMKIDCV